MVLSKAIPFTEIGFIVIAHVAVKLPSTVVTVMFAEPSATAVTTPLTTVATAVLSEAQITSLLVALAGAIVATRVAVSFTSNVTSALSKVTPVTGRGLTVTWQVAVNSPSTVVAVMVAVPTAIAVTTPSLTVAIFVSLLLHFT